MKDKPIEEVANRYYLLKEFLRVEPHQKKEYAEMLALKEEIIRRGFGGAVC